MSEGLFVMLSSAGDGKVTHRSLKILQVQGPRNSFSTQTVQGKTLSHEYGWCPLG